MVVDREREILAFVPVEYWTLEAELARRQAARRRSPPAWSSATARRSICKTGVEAADRPGRPGRRGLVGRRRPPTRAAAPPDAPFTTSTLQQEASRKLGFTARRTMIVAQQLYEGIDVGRRSVGLITYMRTDSVNVAQSALDGGARVHPHQARRRHAAWRSRAPTARAASSPRKRTRRSARPRCSASPRRLRPRPRPRAVPAVRPDLEALRGVADGLGRLRRDHRRRRRPGRRRSRSTASAPAARASSSPASSACTATGRTTTRPTTRSASRCPS